MIDHTKYDKIHVTTLMSASKFADDTVESLDNKIRQTINQLITEGYDIIDIKQNLAGLVISYKYSDRAYHATATIYYGKLKVTKK